MRLVCAAPPEKLPPLPMPPRLKLPAIMAGVLYVPVALVVGPEPSNPVFCVIVLHTVSVPEPVVTTGL